MNPYRTNLAAPAPITITRATGRRIYPKHYAMLRRAAGASVFAAYALVTPAIETGCGATNGQIQQTITDGEALATCILANVLGGVTDPLVLAQKCAGALPAVIADVISDFETKQLALVTDNDAAAPNAQPLPALMRRKLSDPEKQLLDEAKRRAVEILAAASKSKPL